MAQKNQIPYSSPLHGWRSKEIDEKTRAIAAKYSLLPPALQEPQAFQVGLLITALVDTAAEGGSAEDAIRMVLGCLE